jgi:IS30 family transposase
VNSKLDQPTPRTTSLPVVREGRLPTIPSIHPAKDGVALISHERIYQHVWKDKKDGGKLYLHLRHSGKKYNKRKGKNSGRGLIPNRVDIDQRPSVVGKKPVRNAVHRIR